MLGYKTKLTSILGTAVALSFGFADRAAAGPPPADLKGYGLQQWMNSQRGSAPAQSPRVGPSYSIPRSYSRPTPVAFAPSPAPGAATTTVTIRGADGTLRTFPVEGSAVVERQVPGQGTRAFVSVRDADGVVRSYPVENRTRPAAAPVMTGPCR